MRPPATRCTANGVEVGEVQDLGGVLYARFEDPDGNSWLLQQWPVDGMTEHRRDDRRPRVGGAGARDPLSLVFAALADPTRRAILARLKSGPATVGELGGPFEMSGPAVSKHLRVLERAGLVSRSRVAQARPAILEAAPSRQVAEWAEEFRQFWDERFDRLDDYLTTMTDPDTAHGGRRVTAPLAATFAVTVPTARRHLDRRPPRLRRAAGPGVAGDDRARAPAALARQPRASR